MRYWDSSALVPLLVAEQRSSTLVAELERDSTVIAWWGSTVECVSALARLEREGSVEPPATRIALERLDALEMSWAEVQPSDGVRSLAIRLLRMHALRAGDALQLAAALVAAEGHPGSLTFVTLDDRLALAAEREGLAVVAAGA